jgi:hypothetical protein
MERNAFHYSHSHSNHLHSNNQSRTIFSFFSNDPRKYDDDDDGNNTENEMGKTRFSMPSRKSDTDLTKQQEELKQLKQQSNRRRKELYELFDSPIGSFPWSQLRPLLYYLCETESTIRYAFYLLDRAAKEPDAKTNIPHEMVYQVAQQWFYGYVAQQKNIDKPRNWYYHASNKASNGNESSNDDNDKHKTKNQRMPTPLNVWKRIINYQRVGVPLESSTYIKIMEGTTHVKSNIFDNPNGPKLAETILDEMMAQSKSKNPLIRPSAYPFTVAMLSWEQAAAYSTSESSREAPRRALALLHKLKSLYASGWGSEFMPSKNSYRRVMNIFAHRGDGDQVEALLEELYAMYLDHYEQGHENSSSLMPTTPFFSLVLYAWSKSRDPDAAERAEAILETMLKIEESGEIPNLKVHSQFFNIVMVCWSKQRTLESTIKVQSIFDRMVEYSEADPTKKPVGASYLVLITTWSRFDPAKAEEFFWKWKEDHDNKRCEMRVESGLIWTLVSSWCKIKTSIAAERSNRLIQFAIDEPLWHPSTAVFNIVIKQWCQQRTPDGLEQAEAMLKQMIAYHKANPGTDTRPNKFTYLPIVRSWVDFGQLERAEELLVDFFSQQQIDDHDNSNSSDTAGKVSNANTDRGKNLDIQMFNCILRGWLSKASKMPEAAARAEDILLLTKTYGVKPTYASFQYVLDAWWKNKANFSSPWNNSERPKADAVLALLNHEYGSADTTNELYLHLRRGLKLLSVNTTNQTTF